MTFLKYCLLLLQSAIDYVRTQPGSLALLTRGSLATCEWILPIYRKEANVPPGRDYLLDLDQWDCFHATVSLHQNSLRHESFPFCDTTLFIPVIVNP
jgi:hypothetical protein